MGCGSSPGLQTPERWAQPAQSPQRVCGFFAGALGSLGGPVRPGVCVLGNHSACWWTMIDGLNGSTKSKANPDPTRASLTTVC